MLFRYLVRFTIIYYNLKLGNVAQSNQVQPDQCLLLAMKSAPRDDRANITYFVMIAAHTV